MFRKIRLI
jgi:hypothetical protein